MMLQKIVSGGQTGVDRAALDVAQELGLRCGGWCPKGRRAEDGRIPDRYPLQETESEEYPVRTERNVRDSDGTLIITRGEPDGGTSLTIRLALQHGKPYTKVDFDYQEDPQSVLEWMRREKIAVLNVAGPRENSCAGISEKARAFLRDLFLAATAAE